MLSGKRQTFSFFRNFYKFIVVRLRLNRIIRLNNISIIFFFRYIIFRFDISIICHCCFFNCDFLLKL